MVPLLCLFDFDTKLRKILVFRIIFLSSFLYFNHTETLWYYTVIGFTFMVERFRYSPWCSIIPLRNIFHRMLQPSCASVELMNRSCFSRASASEQLGPESFSFTLAYLTYRVITFSDSTVSYSLDAGCLIFLGTVPRMTCPVFCMLPKSIQYSGVSWLLYSETGTAFSMFQRSRRDFMLSVQVIIMLARLSRLASFRAAG